MAVSKLSTTIVAAFAQRRHTGSQRNHGSKPRLRLMRKQTVCSN
jgi:hypothetical protein